MATITLLSGQTSNASGTAKTWPGGYGTLVIDGTFDGATVTIEAAKQDGDFEIVQDGAFTNAERLNLTFGANMLIRATVSGAGASTDLDAVIVR